MKNSRKLIWIVATFFVLHLILQLGFLFIGFAATMQQWGNPDDDSLGVRSKAYWWVFNVLSFPITFLFERTRFLNNLWVGLLGYIPFILNSALWSLGLYFLIRKITLYKT